MTKKRPMPAARLTEEDECDALLMYLAQRSGHHAAFTELSRRIKLVIISVLVRSLPAREIEDALAAVSCRIWEKRHLYSSDGGSVRAWVARIARNWALDWYRKNSKSPRLLSDLEALNCEGRGPDPAIVVADAEESQHSARVIAQELATFRPFEQACFLLRLRGTRFADIACLLKRPIGTVVSATRRVCKRLQVVFKENQDSQFLTKESFMSADRNTILALLREIRSPLACLTGQLSARLETLTKDPAQHGSDTNWAEVEDLAEGLRSFVKMLPKSFVTKVLAGLAESRQLLKEVPGHRMALAQLREIVTLLRSVSEVGPQIGGVEVGT